MEYISVILKTLAYYFLLILIFRVMGKREVGQLGTFDLVVFMLIAELVALGIEKNHKFIIMTVPIIILTAIQIVMSKITLKSNKLRDLIDGKPTIIIDNGIINFNNMEKQRYTLDDLLLQLRQNSVKNIEDVSYALLENNGKLSVFKKDKDNLYPLPIILDGVINIENLKAINKTVEWVNGILDKKNIQLEDVFYAFNKKNDVYIIKKD